MDKIEGSGIWTFDGTSLSNTCYSVKREYKSGKKDKCDDETPQWDSNGGYYCEDKSGETSCKMENNKYETVDLCGKNKDNPVPCVVELKDATDLSIKQKLSELIRANINKAGNNNQFDAAMKQVLAANLMQGTASNIQSEAAKLNPFTKCNTYYSDKQNLNDAVSDVKTVNSLKDKVNIKCERLFGDARRWSCVDLLLESDCKYNNGEWLKPQTINQDTRDDFSKNVKNHITGYKAALSALEDENKSGFDVDAAKSAYTSNQNYLNSKNKEREDLKAEADTAQKEAINSFTTTGMNIMNKAITSSMEAQSNKETLTGACYFSDENGKLINRSPIMRDGESKKATWSFLQSAK